jgi:hypothetical protein
VGGDEKRKRKERKQMAKNTDSKIVDCHSQGAKGVLSLSESHLGRIAKVLFTECGLP